MVGEKYLNPDSYFNGSDWADNESMYAADDNDTDRTTYCPVPLPANYVPDHTPMQDTPGMPNIYTFGSAHADSCNMCMCDGSVRADRLHDRPRDPPPAGQSPGRPADRPAEDPDNPSGRYGATAASSNTISGRQRDNRLHRTSGCGHRRAPGRRLPVPGTDGAGRGIATS